MKTPLVSVIMTVYNQDSYILKAINSVLSQEANFNYELIISNDASTDNTKLILNEFSAHDNITIINKDENVGISKNWFEAIMLAKGDYITTLEGDDFWTDNHKLQKQIDFLYSNPKYIGVSHKRDLLDDNGKKYNFFTTDADAFGKSINLCKFSKSITFSYTACMHKNIFLHNGAQYYSFVTANKSIADFALCLLILNQGNVFVMDESMAVYRISGETKKSQSYTSSKTNIQKYNDSLAVIKSAEEYGISKFNFVFCYSAWSFMPFLEALLSKSYKDMKYILNKMGIKSIIASFYIWNCLIIRMIKFKIKRKR